ATRSVPGAPDDAGHQLLLLGSGLAVEGQPAGHPVVAQHVLAVRHVVVAELAQQDALAGQLQWVEARRHARTHRGRLASGPRLKVSIESCTCCAAGPSNRAWRSAEYTRCTESTTP